MKHSLTLGQRAPEFEATDIFGKKIRLADSSTKYTLLVFLRYAGCPWCNLAIHRLAMEQTQLNMSRCQIIAFIQSSKENIIANIYDRHKKRPEFPIIADSAQKFYKLYGVKSSITMITKSITKVPQWVHSVKHLGFKQGKIDGNLLMVPASFLVSEGKQTILSADYNADFFNNDTFTNIYQKLIFGPAAVTPERE